VFQSLAGWNAALEAPTPELIPVPAVSPQTALPRLKARQMRKGTRHSFQLSQVQTRKKNSTTNPFLVNER